MRSITCLLVGILFVLVAGGSWAAESDRETSEDVARKFDRPGGPLYAGIGGVEAPMLIPASKVNPVYPAKGRKAGVSARCLLQPVITKKGAVGPLEVTECVYTFKDGTANTFPWPRQTDEYGFAQACYDAVKQWRYEPATLDGQPVDVYFTVMVSFELDRR
jgi:hypothetical protein